MNSLKRVGLDFQMTTLLECSYPIFLWLVVSPSLTAGRYFLSLIPLGLEMTDLGVCRQSFVVSPEHAGVGGRAGLPLVNLRGTKEPTLNSFRGNDSYTFKSAVNVLRLKNVLEKF